MSYIGNTSTTQAFTPAVDFFSGTGSATAFTLSRPVASVAQVQVTIDNVAQNPSSAYTVSANTITFTSAPLSGTNNIYVYYTSPITQVIAPGQGTVNTTALGNITNIASGNSSLTLQTGSGNTTAVTVDTSQNVGIGTTSPQARTHVYVGASGVTPNAECKLVVENSGTAAIGILAPAANESIVYFGSPTSNVDGSVVYTHSSRAMSFRTGGNTERMRISSAGVVTAPYQPCFHAYRTTTQTGTSPFTILFDTAPVNVGSSYSTSTGRFTAPVTGNYFFLFHSVGLTSAWSTFLDIFLYKNGTTAPTILSNRPTSTSGTGVEASLTTSSGICNLTVGDYVEIKVASTSIYSDGNAWLKFMGFLIG